MLLLWSPISSVTISNVTISNVFGNNEESLLLDAGETLTERHYDYTVFLGRSGGRMSAGEWDYVMLMAPALTVLFPADAAGALCPVSRTLRIQPPGLSRRQLLAFLHAFYQVNF
jgi:hypothetical protein